MCWSFLVSMKNIKLQFHLYAKHTKAPSTKYKCLTTSIAQTLSPASHFSICLWCVIWIPETPKSKIHLYSAVNYSESQQVGRKQLGCLIAQCMSAHILVLVPPNNTFIWRILALDTFKYYKWIIFWRHKTERNKETGMFDSLSISYLNSQVSCLDIDYFSLFFCVNRATERRVCKFSFPLDSFTMWFILLCTKEAMSVFSWNKTYLKSHGILRHTVGCQWGSFFTNVLVKHFFIHIHVTESCQV